MKQRVLAAFAIPALAFAGCGSVTSDIDFQPPASGWTASPPILGRTQIWIKSGSSNHNSVVVLVRGVNQNKDIFDNPGLSSSNARMNKDEHVTICGNEQAEHFVGTGKSNGAPSVFEAYAATVHGEKYLAFYVRPEDQPTDLQAESAIKSLCPK